MSSMETINEEIQPDPEMPAAEPAQKAQKTQAKRVFIGFAATITVGLAIAGWYVGGRILAAEKAHAATVVKATAVKTAPVVNQPVVTPPKSEPVAVQAEKAKPAPPTTTLKPSDPAPGWNTVDPKSGELYLQLAAMGPISTKEYLKTLDAKGIRTRIAPGPSEHLYRILMGPYSDMAALN